MLKHTLLGVSALEPGGLCQMALTLAVLLLGWWWCIAPSPVHLQSASPSKFSLNITFFMRTVSTITNAMDFLKKLLTYLFIVCVCFYLFI